MRANLLLFGLTVLRIVTRTFFGGLACGVLGAVIIGIALGYIGLLVQLDPTPLPDYSEYGKEDAMSGLAGGICFASPFCGVTGGILFGFFSLLCSPNDSLLPSKAVILKIGTRKAKTVLWILLFYLTAPSGESSYFLELNEGMYSLGLFMMGAMLFCQLAGLIRDWHDENPWPPVSNTIQLQGDFADKSG